MNLKDFIKKREEKFEKLGGEEILNYYNIKLPEGHLTRGYDFPESARELDPERVKHFHRQSIIQFAEMMRELPEKLVLNISEYQQDSVGKVFEAGYNKAIEDFKKKIDQQLKDIRE